MHDCTRFTTEPIKEIMKDCVYGKTGGHNLFQGFQGMDLEEIQQLIDTTPEELTEDDLMEMSASEPISEDEEVVEEAVPEKD